MEKKRTRKRVSKKIDAEFIIPKFGVETLAWEFYDTQTITKNQLTSKYKEFWFFLEPLGTNKGISETNMHRSGMLCASMSFQPYVMFVEVLEPCHDYIRKMIENNWAIEFWISQKIWGQTTGRIMDLSYCPKIDSNRMFSVAIRFNEDFMLREDVRIKVRLQGRLERAIC